MYTLFQSILGANFTEPSGAPDLVKYRLVDMYTRCTEPSIKEEIVTEFAKEDGRLRIVLGTIAFGMGLDCPDVRQIIHWGMSSDIESYIQETGRSGRDGYMAIAVIFYCSSDNKISSPHMINYCLCFVADRCFLMTLMIQKILKNHVSYVCAVTYARRCVIVIFVQHQSISLDMLLLMVVYDLLHVVDLDSTSFYILYMCSHPCFKLVFIYFIS